MSTTTSAAIGAPTAPANELSATFAGIKAQLRLVFPETLFGFRVIPATLTRKVWTELTSRTPVVMLGWDGFRPQEPASRRFSGASGWGVFVVTRNAGGPAPRLLGDARGPGLLDMVRAAIAVLAGHTLKDIGTITVKSASQLTSEEWDMEELAVARITIEVGDTLLASGDDLAPLSTDGILRRIGIGWDFAPDLLTDELPIAQPAAPPRVGAIRWDAWYAPGSALTAAVAADLSPEEYQARLPFFASVGSDGSATLDPSLWGTGVPSVMDTEIMVAVQAGLSFWAFLGHAPTAPESTALNLYLASSLRSKLGFCLIEDATDLWAGGAATVSFSDVVAKVQQAGYVTVLNGRPLIFILDPGAAATEETFGGTAGLGAVMADLRRAVQAACGRLPYLVIQCPELLRAGVLMREAGFDAVGAYAVPPWPIVTQTYTWLCSALENWWHIAAAQGLPVVPPLMAGWDPSPRRTTPNALFGTESTDPQSLITHVTAEQIAAHVQDGLSWMAAHPRHAEAGIALLYAWNEHDEGGWIEPTYMADEPLGDTSRLAALADVLKGNC